MRLDGTEIFEIELKHETSPPAPEAAILKLALKAGRIGFAEIDIDNGEVTINHEFSKQFGLGETCIVSVEALVSRIQEEDRHLLNEAVSRTIEAGVPFEFDFHPTAGQHSDTCIRIRGLPYTSFDGRKKLVLSTVDITAEKHAMHHQKTLLHEMSHRLQNLFAVVSALVQSAPKATPEVSSFADDLVDRIISLGRAYDLAKSGRLHETVSLVALLRSTIEPHVTGQMLTLTGPDISIAENQISTVTLVLHELVTNAAKHGAISAPDGCVDITWSESDSGHLVLNWRETLPGFSATGETKGYGTQLVEMAMAQLDGSFRRSYDEKGAHIELIARFQAA